MPDNKKLVAAVEEYFDDLRKIKASGGGTAEMSYYPPLYNLLNAVGGSLKPKVSCISQLAQQGADRPDFGLFAAKQVSKGLPKLGQLPEGGVVEVKPANDDAWLTADSAQVSKYWGLYRLVLVTNTRDFVLLGEDANGNPTKLETFRLAASAAEFDKELQHPRSFTNKAGPPLAEYLGRALSHRAALAEPRDLARLLASYARDGLARVEASGDAPSLNAVRSALEEALGVNFEGERGAAFFRSTLVQTLFYGIFSAWVLWARQTPAPKGPFDWHDSAQLLRVPVIRELFWQLSNPGQLQPLGLNEVLDWTAAALDRVNREAFFARFNEGEAVPYFYEPFLEEFDPALRKQLGVWYTPAEVVRYMVARVDRALKDDLGIEDGLAAENVYVLDPCCGTGAYLAETLKRIAANLQSKGLGALAGAQVKKAATERVFGFEIMPAPFVVAHLQVGLTMQNLDAAFSDDGQERAGVFLTNALTGWDEETGKEPKQLQMFMPELMEERDRADQVKRDTPVLVILGNPPYNGLAGMAVGEEEELKQAYKTTKQVKKPEGQGLNDLYVRFFRMAERRIAEKTGRGVVCFISNYSWLDGLSFTGMRERYLEAFDTIRIDNLNGDKYKTGKTTPDGKPDPSIFSTPGDPVGIQVGTAIVTLVRKTQHSPAGSVGIRHLWGQGKLSELTQDAETEPAELYGDIEPVLTLGLPFAEVAVSPEWGEWPSLPELFPKSFPGIKTSRDAFLVDVDPDRLRERLADYLDPALSHEEITSRYPSVTDASARYDPRAVRAFLLKREELHHESGFVRLAYRPFDTRWLYWEAETKLLDERRIEYKPHLFQGNIWFVTPRRSQREWSPPLKTAHMGDINQMTGSSSYIPAWLRDEQPDGQQSMLDGGGEQRRPNLSARAQAYLDRLGLGVEDLFHHALAVLHDPAYLEANAGALRMEWPRIPLPSWPDGDAPDAANELRASSARGRELAALLDPETPVPGVTSGKLRPELAAIAVPSTADGHNMAEDDFALTVGWGHFGTGDAVMPGAGRSVTRDYTPPEREALGNAADALGDSTLEIHLNGNARWSDVPVAVWNYKLGGYQVLKKWLSYREHKVLGRNMHPDEVRHFTDTARRIAAILMLTARP